MRFIREIFGLASLALCAAVACSSSPSDAVPDAGAGGGADDDGPTTPVIVRPETLPLEVLGDGSPSRPVIAEVELELAEGDVAQASTLWFRCHRCGFYAAPEYEATSSAPSRVKASLRVLGSGDDASTPWVDVTVDTVTLDNDSALHGGLNGGGLFTTRISWSLDERARGRLRPGKNLVQFRFNGTEGESNGFRVLALELRDAGGQRIDQTTLEPYDPRTEHDVEPDAADVKAGRELWYATDSLTKSAIVPRTIHAACASCHASNGRDLQYFNYSDLSIVQRSRFHGLSEAEGRQIVAFLRDSLRETPYAERARPWNPPYQPGPGLDANPEGWAAGAGLDAVLESPSDALKAVFGKPLDQPLALTQADVDAVMNPDATLNAREMQVPLQYPDWNAWLPSIHPSDVWPEGGKGGAVFESGGGSFPNGGQKDPYQKYLDLRAWFEDHQNVDDPGDWSHLTPQESDQIRFSNYVFGWEAYNYLGGGRGNHVASEGQFGAQVGADNLMTHIDEATVALGKEGAFTTNAFIERAVASMLHWNAVKQWEMAQDFRLEGDQTKFIGELDEDSGEWRGRGEAHGWPFNTVSAFFLAPHMVYQTDRDAQDVVTREWYTAWEADNIVGS
ncbi:MAG TPA: hypothetical protein VLC09_13630, partial [Polyangiaceae bacterium]|nr:hypothetical protein [Polyangiaceae bacterium]